MLFQCVTCGCVISAITFCADRVVVMNQFGEINFDMKLAWEGLPNTLGM